MDMYTGVNALRLFRRSFARTMLEVDYRWFIILLASIFVTFVIKFIVKYTYTAYSHKYSKKVISGSEAAKAVLIQGSVFGVNVVKVSGELTDHYDARSMEIRLSESVYENTSIAAIAVSCHEAAHALQHAYGSSLFKARFVAAQAVEIISALTAPVLLLGFIFGVFQLIYAGVIMYGVAVVFNLITLPLEIFASKKAIEKIEVCNILSKEEIKGAKKVLAACALTYVASLATSLLYMFRFIALSRKNK
jgi:Zn-dependent membrane protease YugP